MHPKEYFDSKKWLCFVINTLKALVNEDTLLRTHCCPWCFLGCANWETFVTGTKCLWTKSETFFVSRTQNLCPQQILRTRANAETFVSATISPQQCVLVCQGLNWDQNPWLTPETGFEHREVQGAPFLLSSYASVIPAVPNPTPPPPSPPG